MVRLPGRSTGAYIYLFLQQYISHPGPAAFADLNTRDGRIDVPIAGIECELVGTCIKSTDAIATGTVGDGGCGIRGPVSRHNGRRLTGLHLAFQGESRRYPAGGFIRFFTYLKQYKNECSFEGGAKDHGELRTAAVWKPRENGCCHSAGR